MNRPFRFALTIALVALGFGLARDARAEWPLGGLRVTGSAQLRAVVPDGSGGVFVAFTPYGDSLRVVRITADGERAAGWPSGGRAVTNRAYLGVAGDGAGGLYAAAFRTRWLTVGEDLRPYYTVHAWKLGSDGAFAAQWPDTGREVSAAWDAAPWLPTLGHDDGAGGAYLLYYGTAPDDIGWPYPFVAGHHFHADGSVTAGGTATSDYMWGMWEAYDGAAGIAALVSNNGVLHAGRRAPGGGWQSRPVFNHLPDHVVGALVALPPTGDVLYAWQRSTLTGPDTNTFRMVRMDSLLQVRPGWPETGVATPRMPLLGDGQGGAFLRVGDAAPYRVQRVHWVGSTMVAEWPEGALPQYIPGLQVLDGSGGLFLAWTVSTALPSVALLRATHWRHDGTVPAHWPEAGAELSTTARREILLSEGGPDRAYLAWTDAGADTGAIYLQMLADDAPVPVKVSLVSADAEPDRVVIEWFAQDRPGPPAVERRVGSSTWAALGRAVAVGSDRWRLVDEDVEPGQLHEYRLMEGGQALTGSEVSLRVPAAAAFALRGFVGNPLPRDATIEFSLPDAAPARLEVFDVASRRVFGAEVGPLGAGLHRVSAGELRDAPAGLLFVRLVRGAEVRTARGTKVE